MGPFDTRLKMTHNLLHILIPQRLGIRVQQFHQLKEKATAKPKAPTQEKPVTRITASKAQGAVDPDKMSPDQWLKWREGQLRAKRK